MRHYTQAAETPNKRPPSITVIGCLFVAAGAVGVVYHTTEFNVRDPLHVDLVWALLVRVLAIIGGVFLLRGANWARWLLLVWMAYHVILSAMHSLSELAMHVVIFAAVAYVLLSSRASSYYAGAR